MLFRSTQLSASKGDGLKSLRVLLIQHSVEATQTSINVEYIRQRGISEGKYWRICLAVYNSFEGFSTGFVPSCSKWVLLLVVVLCILLTWPFYRWVAFGELSQRSYYRGVSLIKRRLKPQNPRKDRRDFRSVGSSHRVTADTFSGSGAIPAAETICPTYLTCGWQNWHLSIETFSPHSSRRSRTFISRSSCSSSVLPKTIMLSR